MSAPILEYVIEYKKIVKEVEALQNEIRQLRLRLKPRMTKLMKEKEKYEEHILKYLERQNDPGIKFQDIVLYKEPKKVYQPKQYRNDRLVEILEQHNVRDPQVVDQVMRALKRERVVDSSKYTLKVKPLK